MEQGAPVERAADEAHPKRVLAAVAVLTGVVFGSGLASWEVGTPPVVTPALIVVSSLGGVLFGAAMAAFVRVSWRPGDGLAGVRARSRAVREGSLPPDATAATWWRPLQVRAQNARQVRWLFPALVVVYLGIGTVQLLDDHWVSALYWLVFALLPIMLSVRAIATAPHDLAVIERLLAELDARETDAHSTPTSTS